MGLSDLMTITGPDQTKRWLKDLKWEKHLYSEEIAVSLALEPPQLLALCFRKHVQD